MINRVGEKWTTNEGYEVEIIEYFNNTDCTIKFEKGHILKGIWYKHLKSGTIKNPNHPSVFGIGYKGEGNYLLSFKGKNTLCYTLWNNLLRRCYSEKSFIKHPSYIGCSVHPDWHNFQVFAEWFYENYKEDFDLDKDILVKGNKIYSPETCCFVPQEINILFTNCKSSRGELPIGVIKHYNRFQARVNINHQTICLGTFKTPEKAFQVYKKAKEKEIKDTAKIFAGEFFLLYICRIEI